jgi:hypothetical protein
MDRKYVDQGLGWIFKQIAGKDLYETHSVVKLVDEINEFLNNLDFARAKLLVFRGAEKANPEQLLRFFRSAERLQITKLTLQYMLSFLKRLPSAEEIMNEPVNPYEQFKSFILFSIQLLNEEDVVSAVLREYNRFGSLNDRNFWTYKGRISESRLKMLDMIQDTGSPTIKGYRSLFEALRELCLFWFRIRSEDHERIRKSDIYLYTLASILSRKTTSSV